jgi:hypothetical protein
MRYDRQTLNPVATTATPTSTYQYAARPMKLGVGP